MTRRPKRSGISYIEDDNDRSITFSKRRAGLYKTATDLSTLTGARVAIALESKTVKMSSFGTPLATPIIDCFLSGNAPVDPFVDEEQNAKITFLQNELFKAEKEKFIEDSRTKETIARAKEIQETSRKAKLVYGKVEDLSVEELHELVHDFSQIKKEINDRLRLQQPTYQLEAGGSRDSSLGQLSSSPSPSSQIQMPPRRLPWTPIQPYLHLPRSSRSLPELPRSQSSLLHPSLLPSEQARSMPLFQLLRPQHTLAVEPQAQMMPSPIETYQHNYNTQGMHINGNISQSTLMSALPPPPPTSSVPITSGNEYPPPSSLQQPPPTPLLIEAQLHLGEQPENQSNTRDFAVGHPFANYQWPSPIPSNEPYYDIRMYGMDFNLDHGDYGGQAAYEERDMPSPSGLHQQAYDCPYRNIDP
ncbi:unnamed protein product [Urochloa decumbens]|uniref:MADS-box domain-containing protein n=1 Tax=Urochloa decumbens TaxID=240449 RepID=A0ABC9GDS5_9POAL